MVKLAANEPGIVCSAEEQSGPLGFPQLFGREAAVEIDLGCGDGTFITALAAGHPDRDFLGIERLLGRLRTACRRAAKLQLANVHFMRADLISAVAQLIPDNCVSAVHVLFPDPWPKRRHHRRRTVTPEFVSSIHRILIQDGLLHIASDYTDYYERISRIVAAHGGFKSASEQMTFPRSKFEERFVAAGTPIHRLLLRKSSPVR